LTFLQVAGNLAGSLECIKLSGPTPIPKKYMITALLLLGLISLVLVLLGGGYGDRGAYGLET
jgi:hypothetical protein